MIRSRSKRNYYYYHHDYDNDNTVGGGGRTKPRYNNTHNSHSQRGGSSYAANNRPSKLGHDTPSTVKTTYHSLCPDMKAGRVIGKSGSIIKYIRRHTGAWINVHEPILEDEEQIIEISDTQRRDPEGRMRTFSPAQEALLMVHDRILDSDAQFAMNDGGYGNEKEVYGGGRGNRVVTRLVVSEKHVSCLLGKGGKIIEQMRIETKANIRIFERDRIFPRCVSKDEEIVQVVGDVNAVKHAITIISSLLREIQHCDRSHGYLHGRLQAPERFFPDDVYIPHMRCSSVDGLFGAQFSASNYRGGNYSSRQPGYTVEAGTPMADNTQPFYGQDIVFRMLCPVDKVNKVVGESDGIVDLLQNEIGVDVKVSDLVSGSDEQIIIISSKECPDDELFPAQEALLHIQTHIIDVVPDIDNTIRTKLIVPSSKIGCLEGGDGSLSEMERLTGAKIEILPREKLPVCVSGADELVQVGGGSSTDKVKQNESECHDEVPSTKTRILKPFVARSTLEIVIPEDAVPQLVTKSKNKLAQISELSGANVTLVEDIPEKTENIIRISGTPEQAERAQSLLQGIFLSTREDGS